MKNIIIIFILSLFVMGCSTQIKPVERIRISTLKVLNTNPDTLYAVYTTFHPDRTTIYFHKKGQKEIYSAVIISGTDIDANSTVGQWLILALFLMIAGIIFGVVVTLKP